MKEMKPNFQILTGAGSIGLLWIISAIAGYSLLPSYIQTITVLAIPILLFTYLIICIKRDLKFLYFSAVVTTLTPIIANILLEIFSDDGSLITWIFGFTIGIFLYPINLLILFAFDGTALDFDICVILFISSIIFSLLIYIITRLKNNLNKTTNKF